MIVPVYPSHRVLQVKYNQIKNNVLHHLILSGNFIYLRIKNLAWDFLGVKF